MSDPVAQFPTRPGWHLCFGCDPRRWAIEFSVWFPPRAQTDITLHVLCFWVSLVRIPTTERSQSNG